jgi:hypothetical protein
MNTSGGGNSCPLPTLHSILSVNTNNKTKKKKEPVNDTKAGTHLTSGGSGGKLFNEVTS